MLEDLGIPYGEAAVLSPVWYSLRDVGRALRAVGVPVMGPGSRPYRGSHLFGALAEQIAAYVEQPETSRMRRIERELFDLVSNLTGHAPYRIFSYAGRRLSYALVRIGEEQRLAAPDAHSWLLGAAERIGEALFETGFVTRAQAHCLLESVSAIEEDIFRNGLDPASLSVADLGLFAASRHSLRLLTLHGAKGREFDAVAIIDVFEGRVPDYRAQSEQGVEESARLLYVGMTRTRRLLMFVPYDATGRNGPSRFLGPQYLDLIE